MNHKFLSLAILLATLAAGKAAAQDDTNAVPVNDYRAYQLIAARNVFNPNRTGGRRSSTTFTRVARTDSFTLVGTMSSEKGTFAFFESSSSAYRKTASLGQTIAGYRITEISADTVKLAASSNQFINLPVGTVMRRPEGGLWTVAGRAEPAPAYTPAVDGAPAAPDGTMPALPAGPESDAAKRLMLKRLMEK